MQSKLLNQFMILRSSPSLRSVHKTSWFTFIQRSIHNAAKTGFTEANVEYYEKGRPTFPKAVLDVVHDVIVQSQSIINELSATSSTKNIANGLRVVELGSGTGKFTEVFMEHLKSKNTAVKSYLAVEPSKGFRNKLLDKDLQGVTVVDGLGEAIPNTQDSTIDVVVAAQAFHWMANEDTLKEVYRVLKRSGVFILLWSSYDRSKPWLDSVEKEILTPSYDPSTPRQQTDKWRECFMTEFSKSLFSPLHGFYHNHEHIGDREVVVNRILSTSCIADKDPAYQDLILNKLHQILNTSVDLRLSKVTGLIPISYNAQVIWTFKNY